jgi:CBS-domain-containing membrane protein
MLVRDHMSRKVVTVDRQSSAEEARVLLRRHRIRQLPVLRDGRLVGIITDRDLRSASGTKRTIADVMTAKPFVISPMASVDEAARLLRTYKIGAVPVVEEGRLVGILSAADILDAFVELSGVGEPTYRLTLVAKTARSGDEIRRLVENNRGEVKWMHPRREGKRREIQLRAKVRRIDDLVTKLEAAGFEVVGQVASGRR